MESRPFFWWISLLQYVGMNEYNAKTNLALVVDKSKIPILELRARKKFWRLNREQKTKWTNVSIYGTE